MIQPFPDVSATTIFPLPESNWMEYKRSLGSVPTMKIVETLCAMLNAGGGYMVFGIHDESRTILGINMDKDYDDFLLRVDNIYHSGQIRTENGQPITYGTVKISTGTAQKGNTLCVITAIPEQSHTYHLKDGTIVYRLGASNYRHTATFSSYSQSQVDLMVQHVHDSYRSKLLTAHKDYSTLMKKAKLYEEHMLGFQEALFARILNEKARAEKELRANWWKSLLCL